MDSFPEDFSYDYSNKYLCKINIEKDQGQLKKCRQYVYDVYKNAIGKEYNYMVLNLEDHNFGVRNILLGELLDKFPTIYYVISSDREKDRLSRVNKLTTNKLAQLTKFYVGISDFFDDEIISSNFSDSSF